MASNALVTGASGFVGLALLRRLVAEGACSSIVALHKRPLRDEIRRRFGDAVHWVQADITRDDLTAPLANIDTVFHLAAYSSISETSTERRLMEEVNVLGTQRLADACRKSGVRHFIFVSSIAACEAGSSMPITEESGFPVSSYGKTKKAAEDYLLALPGSGFEVTVLRPTALFGEHHLGSVHELVKAISRGRFVVFGAGSNRTNFYYIEDFIDVLMAVKNDARSRGQVFIAADAPCALDELVSLINHALNRQRPIPHIPMSLGYLLAAGLDIASAVMRRPLPLSRRRFRAMTRDIAYSSEKLTSTLGITCAHGLGEGISKTVRWYREQGLI